MIEKKKKFSELETKVIIVLLLTLVMKLSSEFPWPNQWYNSLLQSLVIGFYVSDFKLKPKIIIPFSTAWFGLVYMSLQYVIPAFGI
ncbi:MAG: hypothetical protein AB8C84_08235 [Oligoflexales bacterium]